MQSLSPVGKKSVGPAFIEVSKRYQGNQAALARLANKVITGGGGVCGDHAMNAHPQLSRDDATEIVKYVLSLSNRPTDTRLPRQGNRMLKEHVGKEEQGRYVLTASYTDKGGAIAPLTGSDLLVLRPTKVIAADADALYNMEKEWGRLSKIRHQAYFVLKNMDLKGISKLTYRYASQENGATIEVRTDSPKDPVIATLDYTPTGAWDKSAELRTSIQDPGGKHDLYFVFVKKNAPAVYLGSAQWIRFEK